VQISQRLAPDGSGRSTSISSRGMPGGIGKSRFTWGRTNLIDVGDARRQYIDALHQADRHDIEPLPAFARS
jgi:hypothetical protein